MAAKLYKGGKHEFFAVRDMQKMLKQGWSASPPKKKKKKDPVAPEKPAIAEDPALTEKPVDSGTETPSWLK